MFGQVVVGGIDVRFVAQTLRHAAAQVIGHPQLGAAADERECAHITAYPVRQLLPPGCLDVGPPSRRSSSCTVGQAGPSCGADAGSLAGNTRRPSTASSQRGGNGGDGPASRARTT